MNNYVNFMNDIIKYTCNYAVENGLDPNETIRIVAKNLLFILEIADFSEWRYEE